MTLPNHRTALRVRYGETDQMGVVYHANYVQYFELGRTEFMRSHGLRYADMERDGYRLVVTEVSLRYLRAARYDDALEVATRLAEVTPVRVRFEYHVVRPGPLEEILCTGATTLACVNTENRPTRLRSPWRERLDQALRAQGAT